MPATKNKTSKVINLKLLKIDFKDASYTDPYNCPIARRVKKTMLGKGETVSVSPFSVNIGGDGGPRHYFIVNGGVKDKVYNICFGIKKYSPLTIKLKLQKS